MGHNPNLNGHGDFLGDSGSIRNSSSATRELGGCFVSPARMNGPWQPTLSTILSNPSSNPLIGKCLIRMRGFWRYFYICGVGPLLPAIQKIKTKDLFWSVGMEILTILTDNIANSQTLCSEHKDATDIAVLAALVYSC